MASEKPFAQVSDVVLVILIIHLVYITETNSCNINVCLTWSAMKDQITFKCRVNKLSWQVKFFNQFHKEQAYCMSPIPFSHCYSLSRNCTITQDALHNITMLTIKGRIDNSINGGWTCYHGTNVDNAVVNVTVLREALSTVKHDYCFEKNTAWTYFGVMIAFFVLQIINRIYKVLFLFYFLSLYQPVEDKCKAICPCRNKRCLSVFELVILFMLTLLMALPPLIGIIEDDCSEYDAFIAFGIMLGFLIAYLLAKLNGLKCCQKDNNDASLGQSMGLIGQQTSQL